VRVRVIISSGVGKLHFNETVRAAASVGIDVDFLTGWIPRPGEDALVNVLGHILGEPGLAKRMRARLVEEPGVTIRTYPSAEFAGRGLVYLSKFNLVKATTVAGWAFQIAGNASRKYLKGGDVFHVRSGAGQGGAIRTAHGSGMKVIADHSIAHPDYMQRLMEEEYAKAGIPYEISLQKGLWRVVLDDCEQADQILVNSDFVKRTFVEKGYSPERIDVGYLGVAPRYFHLKQQYESRGQLKILFTGNFDLRKGARVMLEAIRRVRKGGIDVSLRLIGNITNGQVWIKDSDDEFLTHTPFVPPEAILPALADADMFVFPTLIEGCSRSAMEAAAAGLPVITTENCGLPLVNEESVLLVPLNDVERLAETIARAASDEKLREKIGRAAASTISERYTWPLYGKKLLQVYEKVLS
jgi:glycosyltransferase involved in cell wall biosynthesis